MKPTKNLRIRVDRLIQSIPPYNDFDSFCIAQFIIENLPHYSKIFINFSWVTQFSQHNLDTMFDYVSMEVPIQEYFEKLMITGFFMQEYNELKQKQRTKNGRRLQTGV